MHEGGGRRVGSNNVVELKKKKFFFLQSKIPSSFKRSFLGPLQGLEALPLLITRYYLHGGYDIA